jgi:2'-phosphotransferase
MADDLHSHIEERGGGRRGGRGGSRGSRGGGRGGGRGGSREVMISKALSKLLRHAAEDEGLVLDGEGFGRLDQVVSWPFYSL